MKKIPPAAESSSGNHEEAERNSLKAVLIENGSSDARLTSETIEVNRDLLINQTQKMESGALVKVLSSESLSHSSSDSSSDDEKNSPILQLIQRYGAYFMSSNTLYVFVTLLADGAEEIGVFIPLFARSDPIQLVVILITFYALITVSLIFCYCLIRCSNVGSVISRYSKNVMPLLLMGLGMYILSDSILADVIQNN